MTDLPDRLRSLAESLEGDEWEHPLTAQQDCLRAAEEIERLRADLDRNRHNARTALDAAGWTGATDDAVYSLLCLCTVLQSRVERREAEIDRLRAIVAKLPVTADGVPVVPGMTVYYADPNGDDDWFPRVATMQAQMALENLIYANPGWEDVYSTREAAEAMREE